MLRIGWAVTIFLLVHQQLERIDQVESPNGAACAFEHLRFVGIGTELHHQQPAGRSSFVLASTSRTPPVAALLLSGVAMRANMRQSDSSHSIDWRDDPPQEVRAFPQNFLHSAQTPDSILRHLLVRFTSSFEGPHRRLSFLPVSFFKFLPTTILHCQVAPTSQCSTADTD